jgi:hypothetical protein
VHNKAEFDAVRPLAMAKMPNAINNTTAVPARNVSTMFRPSH